jgi:hypothetical protein
MTVRLRYLHSTVHFLGITAAAQETVFNTSLFEHGLGVTLLESPQFVGETFQLHYYYYYYYYSMEQSTSWEVSSHSAS